MEPRDRVTILPAAAPHACATYEEERSEVLASVFEAMCRHAPDPDEMAACGYLLRHLSGEEAGPLS